MEVSGEDPAVINKAVSADLAEMTLCEDLKVGRLSCVGTRAENGSGRGRGKVETMARARACCVVGSMHWGAAVSEGWQWRHPKKEGKERGPGRVHDHWEGLWFLSEDGGSSKVVLCIREVKARYDCVHPRFYSGTR